MPLLFRYCACCRKPRKSIHYQDRHDIERCVFCQRCRYRTNYGKTPPIRFCTLCGRSDNPECQGVVSENGVHWAHPDVVGDYQEDVAEDSYQDGVEEEAVEALPAEWEWREPENGGQVYWEDINSGDTTFLDPWNRHREEIDSAGCVQCVCCPALFTHKDFLQEHYDTLNSGCEEHKVCFPGHENLKHAKQHRHGKCFISTCESKYRREEGWTDTEIEAHIWKDHV